MDIQNFLKLIKVTRKIKDMEIEFVSCGHNELEKIYLFEMVGELILENMSLINEAVDYIAENLTT